MKSFFYLILLLFFINCTDRQVNFIAPSTQESLTEWFLQNEEAMNREVNQLIINDKISSPNDTNWIKKGLVVTQHAPSILGTFAKKVSGSKDCIAIEYLFSQDTLERKTVTIFTYKDAPCLNRLDSIKIIEEETKHFIIRKENKPI